MQAIQAVIDEATRRAGTRRKLAAALQMPEQTLSDCYHGRRGFTAEQASKLANYADVDPCWLWALVAVWREKDEAKRAELEQSFFHRRMLGALACCLVLVAAAHCDNAQAERPEYKTEAILSCILRMVQALMALSRPGRLTGSSHAGCTP